MSIRSGSISLLLMLGLFSLPARAVTVEFMIGDDDGFGGTNCSGNCNPGNTFAFGSSLPALATTGLHVDEPGTDKSSVRDRPSGTYLFRFDFSWNTTSLTTIDSAVVTVQAGSVGRRASGTGYGYSDVYIDADTSGTFTSGDTPLGDLLTGVTTSPDTSTEEIVRGLSFNVASLITPGTTGMLHFLIDGSLEARNTDGNFPLGFDRFALDFAQLTITGNPVPLPPALWLLGSALGGLGFLGRRKSRLTQAVTQS